MSRVLVPYMMQYVASEASTDRFWIKSYGTTASGEDETAMNDVAQKPNIHAW